MATLDYMYILRGLIRGRWDIPTYEMGSAWIPSAVAARSGLAQKPRMIVNYCIYILKQSLK